MENSQLVPHRFQNLSRVPGLAHGVFTRRGGVSGPPYATLNVAWNNGDSPESVKENLRRIKNSMNLPRMVSSFQVHGDTIHLIDEDSMNRLAPREPLLVTQPGDALVTDLRGVGLLVKVADCQAVFLVDPVKRVIANVHCGWRGSVANLPGKIVNFLQERFGCDPGNLLGPSAPPLVPAAENSGTTGRNSPLPFFLFRANPNTSTSGRSPGHNSPNPECRPGISNGPEDAPCAKRATSSPIGEKARRGGTRQSWDGSDEG